MSGYYDILFFLGLAVLAYFTGTFIEKRHYRRIERRERELISLPAVTLKNADIPDQEIASARLVQGCAVISIDYFKRIVAGLRNIFGGTVTSYESLIDRARREAVLRMKENAGDAALIVNVRIETAAIGRSAHKRGVGCLEALAFGTAITLADRDKL